MNEEERFDFEQKHEEDLQRLRGFRLLGQKRESSAIQLL